MSAYSTLCITRARARELFMAQMLGGQIPDAVLERFLDDLLEPRLYNARIVPDGTEQNDDHVL